METELRFTNEQIETAKHVDIESLHVYTLKGKENRDRYSPCPFCGDGTDRFYVHPANYHKSNLAGRWYCRRCTPRGGSAIDYIMKLKGIGFCDAVEFLLNGNYSTTPVRKATVQTTECKPIATNFICETLRDYLRENKDAMRWLNDVRGVYPLVNELGCTGTDGELIAIMWLNNDGSANAVKFRRIDGKEPKWSCFQGSNFYGLFPYQLSKGYDTLVLVESELDALLVLSHTSYIDCLATGGASFKMFDKSLLGKRKNIIAIRDNDDAGKKWYERICKVIGKRIPCGVPSGYKDIGDWWQADKSRSIAKVIDELKTGRFLEGSSSLL